MYGHQDPLKFLCPLCGVWPESLRHVFPYISSLARWESGESPISSPKALNFNSLDTTIHTPPSLHPSTIHEADNFFSQMPESAWTMAFSYRKTLSSSGPSVSAKSRAAIGHRREGSTSQCNLHRTNQHRRIPAHSQICQMGSA